MTVPRRRQRGSRRRTRRGRLVRGRRRSSRVEYGFERVRSRFSLGPCLLVAQSSTFLHLVSLSLIVLLYLPLLPLSSPYTRPLSSLFLILTHALQQPFSLLSLLFRFRRCCPFRFPSRSLWATRFVVLFLLSLCTILFYFGVYIPFSLAQSID